MNRVLLPQRTRRERRSPPPASTVSVLRWPSGRSAGGVFEMFSAQETGWFGSRGPASSDPLAGENLLLVGASSGSGARGPAALLSLANASPSQAVRLSIKLAGRTPDAVTGTVVTAPTPAAHGAARHVDPGAVDAAQPAVFRGAILRGKIVDVTVPARSVVVLTVHQARTGARSRSGKRAGPT
jgi:hypothetical protein